MLAGTQVLRMAIPRYCIDDPTLARVIDEAHADRFLTDLADRTVAECLPDRHGELPVVDPDATVLEIAALMARARSPLVAVVAGRPDARRDHPRRAARPDARHVTAVAWAAVAVFVAAYVLIATEKVHRVAAALGGAAVMLLIGASDAEHEFIGRSPRALALAGTSFSPAAGQAARGLRRCLAKSLRATGSRGEVLTDR